MSFKCKQCGSLNAEKRNGKMCYACHLNSKKKSKCNKCDGTLQNECSDCYEEYMRTRFGYPVIDEFNEDPIAFMKWTQVAIQNFHYLNLGPGTVKYMQFATEVNIDPDRLLAFKWFRSKLPKDHYMYENGHYPPPTQECFEKMLRPGFLKALENPIYPPAPGEHIVYEI